MLNVNFEHIKKTINRITNECYNTIVKQIKMREIRWLTSHYEKIQKVYSIWICPRPNPKYRNTITEYKFMENNIHGTVHEEEQNYDLMSVVIIGLGKKCKKDIKNLPVIDLLRTIFVDKISQHERTLILKNNYNVQLTAEDEKELETMCNLSEGLTFSRM